MSWHRLTLNPAQVASGEAQRCREAFSEAFKGLVLRGRWLFSSSIGTMGRMDLFFTPECSEHASGADCGVGLHPLRASLDGRLELLVGHNEITYYMP